MAQTIGHGLEQPPKTSVKNRVILSMSAKQSSCIEAQVFGYLFESVMCVPKTHRLPLDCGIRSRALPLSL